MDLEIRDNINGVSPENTSNCEEHSQSVVLFMEPGMGTKPFMHEKAECFPVEKTAVPESTLRTVQNIERHK